MNGTLALKTAPAIEPVTVAEQKTHMRVDISDDDVYIGTLITAARLRLEDIYGIRFVSQTWYYYLDKFPCGDVIELPIGPVTAISSVKYTPAGAAQATFSASTGYETDVASLPARIALKDGQSWPTDTLNRVNGVCIEFVAGYATAAGTPMTATTPEDLRSAIKILAAYLYENREAGDDIPDSVKSVMRNFRMWQRRA